MLDVHQVGNGVQFQVGLIFIDATVNINDAYYHEVLLTEKLLPSCVSYYVFYLLARQCSCSPGEHVVQTTF